MANIYCTKKLERFLGKNLIAQSEKTAGQLGNWNGNPFPGEWEKVHDPNERSNLLHDPILKSVQERLC